MNLVHLYLAPFAIAALIAFGLTYYIKTFALKYRLTDLPSPRKVHTKPIPRLVGVAVVLTFILLAVGYNLASTRLDFAPFTIWLFDKRLFGVLLGTLILLVIGIIDDVRGLKPWQKLFGHFLAATMVVIFGVSIAYLRLPTGSHLELGNLVLPWHLFGATYQFVVWGDLLTILWIVILINTMNSLDGLDGLAGGVSVIAAIAIFFLSLSLGQTAGALLCLIFAGAFAGFLPWNFNPARIFMGDSGSMFAGFMLGVLSVISGGKMATAFLILGLPLLDVIWVVLRRIFHGTSPFLADKRHLHHRLLALGLNQRQTVIVLYGITAIFGIVAVLTGTQGKIEALYFLLTLMAALVISIVVLEWRKRRRRYV